MANCSICGRKLRLAGRRVLKHAEHVQALLAGLERVRSVNQNLQDAEEGASQEVGAMLDELATFVPTGRTIFEELHAYAHEFGATPRHADDAFGWMRAAENVLAAYNVRVSS